MRVGVCVLDRVHVHNTNIPGRYVTQIDFVGIIGAHVGGYDAVEAMGLGCRPVLWWCVRAYMLLDSVHVHNTTHRRPAVVLGSGNL